MKNTRSHICNIFIQKFIFTYKNYQMGEKKKKKFIFREANVKEIWNILNQCISSNYMDSSINYKSNYLLKL